MWNGKSQMYRKTICSVNYQIVDVRLIFLVLNQTESFFGNCITVLSEENYKNYTPRFVDCNLHASSGETPKI